MYSSGSPNAIISVENNTLICSSSGYPRPEVVWYTCPGVQETYVPRLKAINAVGALYRQQSKCSDNLCISVSTHQSKPS